MFVRNTFEHDARVLKEGSTLSEAGYDVELVAVQAPGLPTTEVREGVQVTRVDAQPLPMKLFLAVQGTLARARDGSSGAVVRVPTQPSAHAGIPFRARRLAGLLRPLAEKAYASLAWCKFYRRSLRVGLDRPADLYLAHDLDTLPIACRARARAGGHLIYDSHEIFAELVVHSPLARRRWMWIERRLLKHVDTILMSSPGHAEVFAAQHGVSPPPVIRNVPRSSAATAGEPPDLRRELGIPSDRRIAIYIGGILPHRPLEWVLESARHVEGCVIVAIGPSYPPYLASLERFIRDHELVESVRLRPPVPPTDVVRYAAAADVGIIPFLNTTPNNYQGLPNKIFEYLAAGIPVVGSDFPQIRAVIERYGVGRTFDPRDPYGIASAISEVLWSSGRYDEMRRNAAAAAAELNWETEAKKFLALVEETGTDGSCG